MRKGDTSVLYKPKVDIKINGISILRVIKTKSLGVILDNKHGNSTPHT